MVRKGVALVATATAIAGGVLAAYLLTAPKISTPPPSQLPLTANPTSGPAPLTVTFSGQLPDLPNTQVGLLIAPLGQIVETTATDALGYFVFHYTFQQAGQYWASIYSPDKSKQYTNNVSIVVSSPSSMAQITLNPIGGPVDTKVTVTGTGFPPNTGNGEIDISGNTYAGSYFVVAAGPFTTNSSGGFQVSFTVPAWIPAPSTMTVMAKVGSVVATANFSITG
jgi:hypothetical protein